MRLFRIMTYAVACMLATASCIGEKVGVGRDLKAGDRIPEFTVTMNDGAVVNTDILSKGVSCIVFFTTGCPDCQQTLPHIQSLYDQYKSNGVQFVPISREDGADSVARYWYENSFTMPYSAQDDRRIYELFAKTRVPRVYICHKGIIKAVFTDQPETPTYEDLKKTVDALL